MHAEPSNSLKISVHFIALFKIVATEKTLELGVDPVIVAIMEMFTAVMGGVIRDTLSNEVPVLFHKEIYATACLAGPILYLTLFRFDVSREINFLVWCIDRADPDPCSQI
jgi:uncharacterized membrane protein YeiH